MEGRRVLRSLEVWNALSFGSKGISLAFEPLNVLIGPNGSGKSNLFEILDLLRWLPRDVGIPIRAGGGIKEWLWKGDLERSFFSIASVWDVQSTGPIHHRIMIGGRKGVEILSELVGEERTPETLSPLGTTSNGVDKAALKLRRDESILVRIQDPERQKGLVELNYHYKDLRIYRRWTFGAQSSVRTPKPLDLPDVALDEDMENLVPVLRRIRVGELGEHLLTSIQALYDGIDDLQFEEVAGDFLNLVLVEDGGRRIPAHRLSDGTLRFLGLLAILCDPDPPPLVGIEEPELGLHPDLIATVARLLIEASRRTQLVVTTHSADLISFLWECPEAVVVCERRRSGTTMKRLDRERLAKWLELYKLGELWLSGEIGGTRW
jgi:predicted ATPase